MDDLFFSWYYFGMDSICVDVYEIIRPSIVCPGQFLCRHHSRFDKQTIDGHDEVTFIKYQPQYITGEFTNDNLFRIPNTNGGKYRWKNLFSLYDILPIFDGDACNTDKFETICNPIIDFIEDMTIINSN